jgi:hypothetical protein
MGWVDKPHQCALPSYYYYISRLGKYFECDDCRRTWLVVGETGPNEYGEYKNIFFQQIKT